MSAPSRPSNTWQAEKSNWTSKSDLDIVKTTSTNNTSNINQSNLVKSDTGNSFYETSNEWIPDINNNIAFRSSPVSHEILNYYALVIGIDQYIKISKLKSAVTDAQEVSNVLSSQYSFIVQTLLNPTRAEIITAINEYRKKLTSSDALLIYYAGHGWLDKEADEGYWLPVDATEGNDVNWIATSSEITGKLRAIEARHVLVVADSCYSGKLTRGVNVSPKSQSELARLQSKKARKILASGGLEPVADTNGKEKHSIFASAFIKALKENTQVMTATDLFTSVRTSVIRNADQTPEFGVIHKAGDDGGDFVFIKKK